MTEMVNDNLKATILDGLIDILGKSAVHDVLVNRDYSFDGDPLLRIRVVSNWHNGQIYVRKGRFHSDEIDRKKLIEAFRYVRTRLEDLGIEELPIISYISKDELQQIENVS